MRKWKNARCSYLPSSFPESCCWKGHKSFAALGWRCYLNLQNKTRRFPCYWEGESAAAAQMSWRCLSLGLHLIGEAGCAGGAGSKIKRGRSLREASSWQEELGGHIATLGYFSTHCLGWLYSMDKTGARSPPPAGAKGTSPHLLACCHQVLACSPVGKGKGMGKGKGKRIGKGKGKGKLDISQISSWAFPVDFAY